MKKFVFGFLMIAGLAANVNANAQYPAHYPRPIYHCNEVKAGPDHGYGVTIVMLAPATGPSVRYGAILTEQTIMGPRTVAKYSVNGGSLNGVLSFESRNFSLQIRNARGGQMPAEMVAELNRVRIGARMACQIVYTTL